MNYKKSTQKIRRINNVLDIIERRKPWKASRKKVNKNPDLNRLDSILVKSSQTVGMNFNRLILIYSNHKQADISKRVKNVISEMLAWEPDILPEDKKKYYFLKFID